METVITLLAGAATARWYILGSCNIKSRTPRQCKAIAGGKPAAKTESCEGVDAYAPRESVFVGDDFYLRLWK